MAKEKPNDKASRRAGDDDEESASRRDPSSPPEDDDRDVSPSETEAEAANDGLDNVTVKPVTEKIGEGRDNLRRRENWFQKRSGRKE